MKISLSTARRMALHAQGLADNWSLPDGKEGAAQIIERLGYVQIDTIHIIQRAHHHTLWSRYPDYEPDMLNDLLAKDRRVFEFWTHAMSYIPMRDYRYYKPRMDAHKVHPRRMQILEESPGIIDHVRDRIRAEGPLGSADFKKPEGFDGGWWNWKPAKHALEALFNMGELMVSSRRNFQRIFDLTERVLPPGVDTSIPTPEEMARYRTRLVLNRRGVLRENDFAWGGGSRKLDINSLHGFVERGEATIFDVEGIDDGPCYAPKDLFDAVTQSSEGIRPCFHIFSPFDNFTIRRQWMEAFFDGFDYRLECYVPAAKRVYGYFVLPVFWSDGNGNMRFIARMDTKADRRPKTFIVKRLLFEADFEDFGAVLPVFAEKLRAFAAFNGCENFAVEDVQPEKVKAALVKLLD